jgi:hypothetical protein
MAYISQMAWCNKCPWLIKCVIVIFEKIHKMWQGDKCPQLVKCVIIIVDYLGLIKCDKVASFHNQLDVSW